MPVNPRLTSTSDRWKPTEPIAEPVNFVKLLDERLPVILRLKNLLPFMQRCPRRRSDTIKQEIRAIDPMHVSHQGIEVRYTGVVESQLRFYRAVK